MGWSSRLRAPLNAAAFGLRRRVAWSRGAPALRDEPKGDLFDYLPEDRRSAAEGRAEQLLHRYRLQPLRDQSTRIDYRDNLYVLDALERLLGELPLPPDARVRAADVGSKNFNYAFALERFFRWSGSTVGRPVELCGIEVDGHGIYPDFYTRADYGRAYASQAGPPGPGGTSSVLYRVQDFLECELTSLDVVTMLFPFLNQETLMRWGLPPSLYAPEALVARALGSLRSGGLLVVVNQNEDERDSLTRILSAHGVRLEQSCPADSLLVHYHELTTDRWANLGRAP